MYFVMTTSWGGGKAGQIILSLCCKQDALHGKLHYLPMNANLVNGRSGIWADVLAWRGALEGGECRVFERESDEERGPAQVLQPQRGEGVPLQPSGCQSPARWEVCTQRARVWAASSSRGSRDWLSAFPILAVLVPFDLGSTPVTSQYPAAHPFAAEARWSWAGPSCSQTASWMADRDHKHPARQHERAGLEARGQRPGSVSWRHSAGTVI